MNESNPGVCRLNTIQRPCTFDRIYTGNCTFNDKGYDNVAKPLDDAFRAFQVSQAVVLSKSGDSSLKGRITEEVKSMKH